MIFQTVPFSRISPAQYNFPDPVSKRSNRIPMIESNPERMRGKIPGPGFSRVPSGRRIDIDRANIPARKNIKLPKRSLLICLTQVRERVNVISLGLENKS